MPTVESLYLSHTLRPLVGFTFAGIGETEPNKEGDAFPLIILQRGKLEVRVAVMQDEEGNGPGWLATEDAKGPGAREIVKELDHASDNWQPPKE